MKARIWTLVGLTVLFTICLVATGSLVPALMALPVALAGAAFS